MRGVGVLETDETLSSEGKSGADADASITGG
jgi:hypothetical protein